MSVAEARYMSKTKSSSKSRSPSNSASASLQDDNNKSIPVVIAQAYPIKDMKDDSISSMSGSSDEKHHHHHRHGKTGSGSSNSSDHLARAVERNKRWQGWGNESDNDSSTAEGEGEETIGVSNSSDDGIVRIGGGSKSSRSARSAVEGYDMADSDSESNWRARPHAGVSMMDSNVNATGMLYICILFPVCVDWKFIYLFLPYL